MIDRRRQLRELYGFDFPEDFFRFWEFVNRLQPLEPLNALLDYSIQLVGPFEVLAGRFDGRTPRLSLLLHWRFYSDPPEFFTVLAGDKGLHWGYYLDDPSNRRSCVASYGRPQALEIWVDGDDLFEAVRLTLEERHERCELDHAEGALDDHEWEQQLADLAAFRDCLVAFGTKERREIGEEYADLYAGMVRRQGDIIEDTFEGMGIVVRPEQYRPLPQDDDLYLYDHLRESVDPADVVEEARQALREGFPGTALKLGKDLWAIGGERHTEHAYELLDAAYAALGREVLREVLRVHRANRDLPSVDILENE